ncbi:MAG TPA: AAA family ATPase [Acidimicrobiales bacterium]|nr:AAA family ATPase [Acidimicrobiales bacterium]
MKLGIVGKGGVGKTTLSSLICQTYAARGKRVVAIDTDSNPNLAMSLGLDEDTANRAPLVPRSLVVGDGGGKLTPAALLDEYGLRTPVGVTLLHAMRVEQAGAGCSCADHYMVRSLLGTAIDEEADVTLVDMEAGLEHLSRSGGTLAYADVLLMVMEPTRKSILTAARTIPLAEDLGIPRIYGVGNKAKMPADGEFFTEVAAEHGVPLAGIVPYDPAVTAADREGTGLDAGQAAEVREAVAKVLDVVDSEEEQRKALLRQREKLQRRIALIQAN